MGIRVPNGSGGYTELLSMKRHDGTNWVDCQFARAYEGGAWVDKWVRKKTILNPGAWVADGITGWYTYSQNPNAVYVEQVAGQYTQIRAASQYSGGFSGLTVWSAPATHNVTMFTKLTVVYGACNPYPDLWYLNAGGRRFSLNNVANTTQVYDITGLGANISFGMEVAATSAQDRYVRIISMELS